MAYALNIQQIRQTRAQLAATNPVLSAFQLCIETDTNVYTAGDGTSRYLDIRGNVTMTPEERRSADDLNTSIATEPLVLFALVSQSGTDAPSVEVGINTIGSFTATRTGSGTYDLSFPTGILPLGRTKVWIDANNIDGMETVFRAYQADEQTVSIVASGGDDQLSGTQLEITVY